MEQLKRDVMVQCKRCGIDAFSEEAWQARQTRGGSLHCADCERFYTGAILVVDYKKKVKGACRSWHGDYDLDDNPLDKDGNRFAGDVALCGHKDCVTQAHRPQMRISRMKSGNLTNTQLRRKRALSIELIMAAAEVARQL